MVHKSAKKSFLYMFLVLVLSIPFYLLGIYAPVNGLPFDLPISFLMIVVPFFLAIFFTWKSDGKLGIEHLFRSILDFRKSKKWAILFSFLCMPFVAVLSYISAKGMGIYFPDKMQASYVEIPIMIFLYFIGAIPEEVGWTHFLTGKLSEEFGKIKAGIIIGLVWAIWHVVPWSWTHSHDWIAGMILLNVFMRTAMVFIYMEGGKSLFTGILFHTMINVCFSVLPNSGSIIIPWVLSLWMGVICFVLIFMLNGRVYKKRFLDKS